MTSLLKRLTVAATLAVALVLALPTTANAQASIEFGPRVGLPVGDYSSDIADQGYASNFLVGGELRISSVALPFGVAVTGDYYVTDPPNSVDTSVFLLGADALFPFGVNNQLFTPYLGVGPRLSVNSVESTSGGITVEENATNFGLGARFGAKFGVGGISPFVEAEYNVIFSGRPDADFQNASVEIERTSASAFNVKAGLLFGF